jgi:ssDNA thymidine ADP-ribosyltransferase, DarT
VSDECIHGFVDGLCATCNPKPVAESAVAVKSAPRSRVAAPPRATVRSLRAAARIPAGVAPGDVVLEQRIYHLTHIRNLPGIVADRALVAGATPVLDIAPATLRSERAETSVGGVSNLTLEHYLPFFLSPDATLWQNLREGSEHPRLSRDALVSDTSDFVLLVSTLRHVVASGHEFVVADGNVEGIQTRFATTRDDAERLLHRLRSTNGGDGLLDAELLVEGSLPLESVTLIGVQNDKVRAAVREILHGSDFTPKISVYPPWFQVTE